MLVSLKLQITMFLYFNRSILCCTYSILYSPQLVKIILKTYCKDELMNAAKELKDKTLAPVNVMVEKQSRVEALKRNKAEAR